MLTLCVFGILVAGCGGSGSTGTTDPSRDVSSADAHVTKTEVTDYARKVNLGAADVPGAAVSSEEREAGTPSQQSIEFARCSGAESTARRVADVKSPTFKIGKGTSLTQVKSSVEAMPTAALAARDYAAVSSARGHACLKRLLPRVLEGAAASSSHFGPATASFLPNLLPAGQKSFGVRISTSLMAGVAGKALRVPVYIDLFEIVAGPAEVNLTVTGFSRPPVLSLERRLLSLLYGRAQAQKHALTPSAG